MKKLMDRIGAALDAEMKASAQRTKLDDLADKLHVALRGETRSIIEAGKCLLEIRAELKHGDLEDWLIENFDLSLRTAYRYISAAEYVLSKTATVAVFENLAPTVLYELAKGDCYYDEDEVAILAATRERRVDAGVVGEILEALDKAKADDAQEGRGDDATVTADNDASDSSDVTAEDAEAAAILDGPPPAVPPPAPIMPPTDFALAKFDETVGALKELRTKSVTHFAGTAHSAGDLKDVEDFLHAVAASKDK